MKKVEQPKYVPLLVDRVDEVLVRDTELDVPFFETERVAKERAGKGEVTIVKINEKTKNS